MHGKYNNVNGKFGFKCNLGCFANHFTITKKGKAVAVVAPFDEKPGGEGLILITGNTGHFKNIPGLRIENWIAR